MLHFATFFFFFCAACDVIGSLLVVWSRHHGHSHRRATTATMPLQPNKTQPLQPSVRHRAFWAPRLVKCGVDARLCVARLRGFASRRLRYTLMLIFSARHDITTQNHPCMSGSGASHREGFCAWRPLLATLWSASRVFRAQIFGPMAPFACKRNQGAIACCSYPNCPGVIFPKRARPCSLRMPTASALVQRRVC